MRWETFHRRVIALLEAADSMPHVHEIDYPPPGVKEDRRVDFTGFLAQDLRDFVRGWQDISRTYTPGEQQLDCRIDAQPAPG